MQLVCIKKAHVAALASGAQFTGGQNDGSAVLYA